jgi:hypothetical protein
VSEYRRFAPASPPVRAAVPAAEPERVYDIKYFSEPGAGWEGADGRRVAWRGPRRARAKIGLGPSAAVELGSGRLLLLNLLLLNLWPSPRCDLIYCFALPHR